MSHYRHARKNIDLMIFIENFYIKSFFYVQIYTVYPAHRRQLKHPSRNLFVPDFGVVLQLEKLQKN